jgi:hypothetical protein
VAFITSAAAEAGYRVVLVDEGARLVCMASYALALERTLSNLRCLRRMYGMAITANQLTFRYRVVIAKPELGQLRRVALSTQLDFVRF